MPAVHIGSRIGWVLQDAEHAAAVGGLPDHHMRGGPPQRPNRQRQLGLAQRAHDSMGAPQVSKQLEHQMQAGLDFFIRVQDDPAALFHQPSRERLAQLSPFCLLPLALVKANLDLVQFRLTHDAGQSQQQAVMIDTRIEEPFAIGDQHAEQRAQLHQLVPVPVVAGQAGGIETEHEAGVPQTNLGD